MSRCGNGCARWTTSGHVKGLMLVLLSLVSIDVRLGATQSWRLAATGLSSEVRRTQCSSWCAVLIYPRSLEQRHPESASGGSAFERKTKFKPRGPARGLHAMTSAVAGMLDPVRVPGSTAAVSRTRASVLPIIMVLMCDSALLSWQKIQCSVRNQNMSWSNSDQTSCLNRYCMIILWVLRGPRGTSTVCAHIIIHLWVYT